MGNRKKGLALVLLSCSLQPLASHLAGHCPESHLACRIGGLANMLSIPFWLWDVANKIKRRKDRRTVFRCFQLRKEADPTTQT